MMELLKQPFVKNNEILLVDRHILVTKLLDIKRAVQEFKEHQNIRWTCHKIQKMINEAIK